jgi:hypothetical protein
MEAMPRVNEASRRRIRVLSILALISMIYFGLTVVALHLLPTGYDPITQAVSDYGVGRYAVWMDLAFFAFGIGIIALAISFSHLSPSSRLWRSGVLLLSIAGVCTFTVGFFATDLEGAPTTTTGLVHLNLSALAFIALVLGTLILSQCFRRVEVLRGFYKSSMVLSVIVAFTFVIVAISLSGLTERIFIVAFYSWLLLTSVRILKTARQQPSIGHT